VKSVRPDQTYSWLFFILIFSSPLFPQSSAVTDSDSGSEKVSWNEPHESLTPLERANQGQTPAATSTSQKQEEKAYGWDIAIYPALVIWMQSGLDIHSFTWAGRISELSSRKLGRTWCLMAFSA
jgi:hypothetical protein